MEDRTAIIVKEIKYWKEHRLLPEKYCDYLLALYTNGQDLYDEAKVSNARDRWSPVITIHFILLLFMIPFSFLVVYFTEFHSLLQLVILIVFLVYSIWVYVYYRKNGYEYVPVALIVTLLLLLLLTIAKWSFNCKQFNSHKCNPDEPFSMAVNKQCKEN
jgi:hypothetical protein